MCGTYFIVLISVMILADKKNEVVVPEASVVPGSLDNGLKGTREIESKKTTGLSFSIFMINL